MCPRITARNMSATFDWKRFDPAKVHLGVDLQCWTDRKRETRCVSLHYDGFPMRWQTPVGVALPRPWRPPGGNEDKRKVQFVLEPSDETRRYAAFSRALCVAVSRLLLDAKLWKLNRCHKPTDDVLEVFASPICQETGEGSCRVRPKLILRGHEWFHSRLYVTEGGGVERIAWGTAPPRGPGICVLEAYRAWCSDVGHLHTGIILTLKQMFVRAEPPPRFAFDLSSEAARALFGDVDVENVREELPEPPAISGSDGEESDAGRVAASADEEEEEDEFLTTFSE